MKITREFFGTSKSGEEISKFVITNNNGVSVALINYGARILSLNLKDKMGKNIDVIVGHDSMEGFESKSNAYGAVCGRVANRIAGAKFTLNGKEYNLFANEGENTLHGGKCGFHLRVWEGVMLPDGVQFTLHSEDGDEGYPGNLDLKVFYRLNNDDELKISYEAISDKDTLINVTNHAYFNIAGEGNGNVLDQVLTLECDEMTEIGDGLIPTGKIVPVEGVFDWRNGKTLGADLDNDNPQFAIPGTYDHNYIIRGEGMRQMAKLYCAKSGVTMDVLPTEPGLQVYCCQKASDAPAKRGHIYPEYASVCLETQHYPDSVHHDNFPSTLLKAGIAYNTETVYAFSVEKIDIPEEKR